MCYLEYSFANPTFGTAVHGLSGFGYSLSTSARSRTQAINACSKGNSALSSGRQSMSMDAASSNPAQDTLSVPVTPSLSANNDAMGAMNSVPGNSFSVVETNEDSINTVGLPIPRLSNASSNCWRMWLCRPGTIQG